MDNLIFNLLPIVHQGVFDIITRDRTREREIIKHPTHIDLIFFYKYNDRESNSIFISKKKDLIIIIMQSSTFLRFSMAACLVFLLFAAVLSAPSVSLQI